MTSHERFIAAINHREPDRVPVDLGSSPSTGISAIAYSNLKKFLGITSGNVRINDVIQQLARPEEDILTSFQIDLPDIGNTFNVNDKDWYNIKLWNGNVAQYPVWFTPKHTEKGGWVVNNYAG